MSAPPAPDRLDSLNEDPDASGVADADSSSTFYPQLGIGKRPPTVRVSFSSSVRPSRSRVNPDSNPHSVTAGPSSGGGGVPLGERVYSIPESTARMSVSIPTGLSSPEATPLPLVPLVVLCIVRICLPPGLDAANRLIIGYDG